LRFFSLSKSSLFTIKKVDIESRNNKSASQCGIFGMMPLFSCPSWIYRVLSAFKSVQSCLDASKLGKRSQIVGECSLSEVFNLKQTHVNFPFSTSLFSRYLSILSINNPLKTLKYCYIESRRGMTRVLEWHL